MMTRPPLTRAIPPTLAFAAAKLATCGPSAASAHGTASTATPTTCTACAQRAPVALSVMLCPPGHATCFNAMSSAPAMLRLLLLLLHLRPRPRPRRQLLLTLRTLRRRLPRPPCLMRPRTLPPRRLPRIMLTLSKLLTPT